MKTQALTINSGNIHFPAVEELIQKKSIELKDWARKEGKHFGKQNLPALDEESLAPRTGNLKAGCEHLAAEVSHLLQAAAGFPEAKMDADHFKEMDKGLDAKIKSREDKNRHDDYELGDHSHNNIPMRIKITAIATFIISIGETMYNTKSFQVTGESMLFAFILSICVSFAVFIFSHVAPFLYKGVKTPFQRRLVVIGSLLLVTLLFIALAIFRSKYLAKHDIDISPFYFVIINLFFFIVSTLISFFLLPSWAEIKENASKIKLALAITKRKKEIEEFKKQKEEIRKTILERTKNRVRIAHYANYSAERIRKLYFETVEIFKSTNLTYRTDQQIPISFSAIVPPIDIKDFEIIFNTSNTKAQ